MGTVSFDSGQDVLQDWHDTLERCRERVNATQPTVRSGRLKRAVGLVLEAEGLELPVGSECSVQLHAGSAGYAQAEVVGFSGGRLLLMPQSEVTGLVAEAKVFAASSISGRGTPGATKLFPVSDALLGRVLDASGNPLDGLGPIGAAQLVPLATAPINPLRRAPIDTVLDVGVRAINAMLTVGRGQRLGLFAGSGVGKSVLLGMMARYTGADVIVVGLIGERGREVKEFIEHTLGPAGLARSVVVAAPADTSPLLRLQGAAYATRLAEYFRDEGRAVLLIMDSLTRYAMAQREVALAVGEPPATKGYPPSVFAKLPALVERAGNGDRDAHGRGGSITAFYTVLAEGDDQQDPVADSARAILDGHIVLSRTLADAGHYPAIDIEASISRAMTTLVEPAHFDLVRRFRQALSRYQRNRDLIGAGAYAPGHDAQLDEAIALYPRMEAFLQQPMNERAGCAESLARLGAVFQPS